MARLNVSDGSLRDASIDVGGPVAVADGAWSGGIEAVLPAMNLLRYHKRQEYLSVAVGELFGQAFLAKLEKG